MNEAFEGALRACLDRHLGDRQLGSKEGYCPAHLAESIRYSLLAPGKRIRPRLSQACGSLLKLPEPVSLAAGIAIEMVHCFTLIHDDLPCMDDDDFRRGRPSNHKQFGEATALLAGDSLFAIALEALLEAESRVEPRNLLKACRRLAWALGPRGVTGGQAAEETLGAHSTLPELRAMHAQKTGALFSASLLIPMDLAGIPPESESAEALQRFAAELGSAFQVVDDLDDAEQARRESDEAATPLSILYYLPEPEARKQSESALREACAGLEKNWGSTSRELIAIAGEVLRRLEPV